MTERAIIVVAESQQPIRESIAMTLIDEGYVCHTAADMQALLALIQELSPNLILADIATIRGRVTDLCAALNRHNPSPAVIITLPYESIGEMLHLTRCGISEYVIKPFLFEDILERIQRILHLSPY